MVGLWFGCWWIGRTPLTAEPGARAFAWAGGTLSAAAVGLFAFIVLMQPENIPWQPFSPEAVAQARAEGKTVMIDFTANWCPELQGEFEIRHRHAGRRREGRREPGRFPFWPTGPTSRR